MHDLEKPVYVDTCVDTAHPIAHVRNVPLSMQDGKVNLGSLLGLVRVSMSA